MSASDKLLTRQASTVKMNQVFDDRTGVVLPRLLTESQAAEILTVTRNCLARWRMLKTGPAWIVLGTRSIRYRATELQRFLEEQTVTPTN